MSAQAHADPEPERREAPGSELCLAVLRLDGPERLPSRHPTYWRELALAAARTWRSGLRAEDAVVPHAEDVLVRLPGCPTAEAVLVVQRLRLLTPTLVWSAGIASWDAAESEDELLGRARRAVDRAVARPGAVVLARGDE